MAAYKASLNAWVLNAVKGRFWLHPFFFLLRKDQRDLHLWERPNIYENAKVARNKAAQGKLNVQKYDKAWKRRTIYAAKYYCNTGSAE